MKKESCEMKSKHPDEAEDKKLISKMIHKEEAKGKFPPKKKKKK
jgi:hypothetical protein